MSESIRFHTKDSIYALLVLYLVQASRDLSTWNSGIARKVTVDGIEFPIAKKLTGQDHDVPGINLIFHDEFEHVRGNPPEIRMSASVHVYVQASTNVSADDRTLDKLISLVDQALIDGGIGIWDLTGNTPLAFKLTSHWSVLGAPHQWRDLTNLRVDGFLHKSKDFEVFYRDNTY
jgi:hypothetical protein